MAMFKGSTAKGQQVAKKIAAEDSPYLSAGSWKVGDGLYFEIVAQGKNSNGHFISAHLIGGFPMNFEEIMEAEAKGEVVAPEPSPETVVCSVNGQLTRVSDVKIGNLAGITLARMAALELAKNKFFQVGDKVILRCIGISPAEKDGYSASPNFNMWVDREER